jgi:hypothetical protein
MKNTVVALVYDFDQTLSTTYMQDYVLIPELGMTPKTFWKKANQWSVDNCADQITGSMYYFMKTAKEKGVRLTKENFHYCGSLVKYYKGVETWFERINDYGKKLGLKVEHYIISSGYEEILYGTSICKYFQDVFGCSYAFGEDGTPVWPARVINYSTKVQYITKINKGLGKLEDKLVNEFMEDSKRRVPYKRIVYFGDGMTDIPTMKLVKSRGGNAIAVYKPKSDQKQTAVKLLKDNRVNFALPADYSEGTDIDIVIKTILEKLATERDLDVLKKREDRKKFKF